uniref:UPF0246 protein MAGMO_0022 n=1 Tax=Magnetococcus massalia (strain MO-1) TaxID=451514 RepID=A0A1S7LCM8_MAGMO|nr:Conserved protein of unknown function [Candidatus Magnetococcus massalia]
MLAVISPAKKLDEGRWRCSLPTTTPDHLTHSQTLIDTLKKLDTTALGALMKISESLSQLNHGRYHSFALPFTEENAKPAVMMFQGDTYQGLDAGSFSQEDLAYAQSHLRILSGLYGVLRPLDLIQPYRLEMGTRLANARGTNLYNFWQNLPVESLNQTLAEDAHPALINLASNEYFKAVKSKELQAPLITPVFKEIKGGQAKVIGLMAKRARGAMARFIIQNRLSNTEDLKQFESGGYRYQAEQSSADAWLFTREAV